LAIVEYLTLLNQRIK